MTDIAHGRFRAGIDLTEVAGTWRQHIDWIEVCEGSRKPSDLTFEHFQTVVSREHESQHRADLFSTPYGLLLWRLEATITNDIATLVRRLGYPPANVRVIDQLRRVAAKLRPVGLDGIQSARQTYDLLDEVDDLDRFRTAIHHGDPSMTMGELTEIGNRCLVILRKRFDLPTTWQFRTDRRPEEPSTASVDGFRDVCAEGILERSAVCWEALWVECCAGAWTHADRLWKNWRHPSTRYRDLGPKLDGLRSRYWQPLLISSLSGPCDPALPISHDVPIEWAMPAQRYLSGLHAFVPGSTEGDPVPAPTDVPSPLEVYRMIEVSLLDGKHGFFGDETAVGNGDVARDSSRSYFAGVLQRFHDEAANRVRCETGDPERGHSKYGLVTLFDEFCVINSTIIGGHELESNEVPVLLIQLMVAYATQQAVQGLMNGDSPVTDRLLRQLRLMASRLTTDLKGKLPVHLQSASALRIVELVLLASSKSK